MPVPLQLGKTQYIAIAVASLAVLLVVAGFLVGGKPQPDKSAAGNPQDVAAYARQQGLAPAMSLDLGNGTKLELVLIPAGKFTMGSSKAEQQDFTKSAIAGGIKEGTFDLADEGPQREVTISKGFYMGVYEVTKGQFAQFISDSGYKTDAEKDGKAWGWDGSKFAEMAGYSWRKTGFEQADDHPVVNVSWNDAVEFCKWLSKKTRQAGNLPTEAQWEYACRAGSKTACPWGDDPDDGKGWCNAADKTAKDKIPFIYTFTWSDGYVFTAPCGSFKPNKLGIYDMIGNAWEWCADWYDKDYYANAKNTDPQGPPSGSNRVLRGGCWISYPRNCRSATRHWDSTGYRDCAVGFRVSVDLK
jgi:formylglycine-generating enzyme required for sulfatase activity